MTAVSVLTTLDLTPLSRSNCNTRDVLIHYVKFQSQAMLRYSC